MIRDFWQRITAEYKSVDELDRQFRRGQITSSMEDVRARIRIAVVDDEEFSALQPLRNHKYDITTYTDLAAISELKPFRLVMIDLQGVGKSLNPGLQGAHIIREVRKNYPEKFIVAYTAGASGELMQPAIETADKFIPKDAKIETWCEMLDNAILQLANPAYVWRKVRGRLLDAGVQPIQLAQLEDAFVRGFDKDKNADLTTLLATSDKLRLPEDARNIVTGVVSSAVFELAKLVFTAS